MVLYLIKKKQLPRRTKIMLKISRLADYATTVMHTLAQSPAKRFSAAQVSGETQIAMPTVSKLLKLLHEAELVNSERGATGGYQLARAPESIRVVDVIAAVDGLPAVTECCRGENVCERDRVCGLRNQWQTINSFILEVLANLNLVDMQRPLSPNQWRHAKNSCQCKCQCHPKQSMQA